MDIKHFTLPDWVEQDLIILEHVKTMDYIADAMTKTLSKTLFYRHYDTYMGLRVPAYCAMRNSTTPKRNTTSIHTQTKVTIDETP
jgi:hypothetical protein